MRLPWYPGIVLQREAGGSLLGSRSRISREEARLRSAGVPASTASSRTLRAGALSLIYAEGSVGSVFLGDDEVVRQVYFALRDRNWNTVPGVISDEDVRITSEGFLVTFSSTHQAGSIRFSWKGTLQGEGNGRLTFTLDGTALTSFLRNRVGFCVLHPMEVAGKPCTVTHPDGTTETASFPDLISPHQPFRQIRKLSYPVSPRTAVTIQLEGEVFEMEDQRNWTDASFKTYSTPLDLPFPVEQPAGSVVHQTILITPSEGAGLPARRRREQAVSITLARQERFRLPQMGFLWRAPFPNAPDILLDRLRRLRPDYLRFDMHPGLHDPGEMAEPLAAAVRLGAPLELAAFLGADEETEMTAIVRAVKQTGAALRRVLVFKEGKKSTPSPSLWTARKTLDSAGLSVALCAGTDAFFAELNRERPDMSAADGVTFSINPQVHVFDNESMVQSLAAQAVTIRTALSFSSGKPVHVSPVTFRMRWNPNATEPEQSAGPPDPRQLSLFGAAWTAGSIHSLASAGADSVTYFETFGGRGLMEGEAPVMDHRAFPSIPGGVFPLFYVFLELSRFKGGRGVEARSDRPHNVGAFAVEKDGLTLLVAMNHTDKEVIAVVPDAQGPAAVRLHSMDSYEVNAREPEGYFEKQTLRHGKSGKLEIKLPENGIAFATFQAV